MLETTLCYLEENGKVLMLHRVKKEHDVNEGKWIGIGGKIEPGESPEECVVREFTEETGLQLTHFAYRGIVNFHSDDWEERMHLYTADAYTGTINASCDEGDLCWKNRDEILTLPLWEGDRVFLSLIWTKTPFFELDFFYHGEQLSEAFLNGHVLQLPSACAPVSS